MPAIPPVPIDPEPVISELLNRGINKIIVSISKKAMNEILNKIKGTKNFVPSDNKDEIFLTVLNIYSINFEINLKKVNKTLTSKQ
jgi:hypothetical protein